MLGLGVDPGLRATGCALVEVDGNQINPVSLFVLTTKPWKGKGKKPTKSADNARCAGDLAVSLDAELSRWRYATDARGEQRDGTVTIECLYVEAFSVPNVKLARDPMRLQALTSSACKTALVWGVLAMFSRLRGVPIFQVSPQRVKRVLTGKPSASKDEVSEALCARFGTRRLAKLLVGVPMPLRNHAYDALAAAVAIALSAPPKKRVRAKGKAAPAVS